MTRVGVDETDWSIYLEHGLTRTRVWSAAACSVVLARMDDMIVVLQERNGFVCTVRACKRRGEGGGHAGVRELVNPSSLARTPHGK